MTYEEYYGDEFSRLKQVEKILKDTIREYPTQSYPNDVEPILYCKSRIKRPESMIRKLEINGIPPDGHTALRKMHDAVGIRVVCSFVDDVYNVAGWLRTRDKFTVIQIKDYLACPKPNGYRSLHLI